MDISLIFNLFALDLLFYFPLKYSNRNCTVSVSIRCGKTINNLVKFVRFIERFVIADIYMGRPKIILNAHCNEIVAT